MLMHLDDALRNVLPDDEYAKLTAYDTQVAATTSSGDFHRCARCAQWAVELAERPGRRAVVHLAESVRAAARQVHDTAHALRFAMIVPGAGAVTDVELSWVDEAVSAARAVAERDGWEAAGPRIVIPAMTAFESMRQSWPFRLDSLHLVRNGRHVHFEVDLHHRDAATPTNTPLTTSFTVTGTTDN